MAQSPSHLDQPQQHRGPAQCDEESKPVPTAVDIDTEQVENQASDESPRDTNHDVHENAGLTTFDEFAGKPASKATNDNITEQTYAGSTVKGHAAGIGDT